MKNFKERTGFIVPKGTYPTIISDNTFSYYEQLCALVAVMGDLNDEITIIETELEGKQDKLTFDEFPTAGSTNPVYSNGIWSQLHLLTLLIQNINATLTEAINGKQDILVFDNEPVINSTNPVTSGGLYNVLHDQYTTLIGYINGKQDILTFDSQPQNGSSNPVTSDGIFDALRILSTAIEGKQDTLTFDTTPTELSTNPCTSGGIFDFVKNITNPLGEQVAAKQSKAISFTLTIAPTDWQIVQGTTIHNYEISISGIKQNAVFTVRNSDNGSAFNYLVSENKFMINTTSSAVDTNTIIVNVIVFNDTDDRTPV